MSDKRILTDEQHQMMLNDLYTRVRKAVADAKHVGDLTDWIREDTILAVAKLWDLDASDLPDLLEIGSFEPIRSALLGAIDGAGCVAGIHHMINPQIISTWLHVDVRYMTETNQATPPESAAA